MYTDILNYFKTLQQSHVELENLVLSHPQAWSQLSSAVTGGTLLIDQTHGMFTGLNHSAKTAHTALTIEIVFSFKDEDVNTIGIGYPEAVNKALNVAKDIIARIEEDQNTNPCAKALLNYPIQWEEFELETHTHAGVRVQLTYKNTNAITYNSAKWQ